MCRCLLSADSFVSLSHPQLSIVNPLRGFYIIELKRNKFCFSLYSLWNFIPKWYMMNANMSAVSSICLLIGLPAPWPALVSMRISLGALPVLAACRVAAYLNEWAGTTRSSWSAVVTRIAGYGVPSFLIVWIGE